MRNMVNHIMKNKLCIGNGVKKDVCGFIDGDMEVLYTDSHIYFKFQPKAFSKYVEHEISIGDILFEHEILNIIKDVKKEIITKVVKDNTCDIRDMLRNSSSYLSSYLTYLEVENKIYMDIDLENFCTIITIEVNDKKHTVYLDGLVFDIPYKMAHWIISKLNFDLGLSKVANEPPTSFKNLMDIINEDLNIFFDGTILEFGISYKEYDNANLLLYNICGIKDEYSVLIYNNTPLTNNIVDNIFNSILSHTYKHVKDNKILNEYFANKDI